MAGGAAGGAKTKPFMEHVHELQLRLMVIFVAILAGAGVAYKFHEPLLELVQKPLGQTLYYTSPAGGFTSLFKLCIAAGVVIATPVILYNAYKFLEPLMTNRRRGAVIRYTAASVLLAYAGIIFAYTVSLPASLRFLSTFGDGNVQSLITIDSYYNFALSYIISFALVFQLPLYVLFINRIKPLKPGGMMGAQRYIILGSFVAAAILTPTPDPFNQFLMAAPAIVLYQIGVLLVWRVNRKERRKQLKLVKAQQREQSRIQAEVQKEAMDKKLFQQLGGFIAQLHQRQPAQPVIIPSSQVQQKLPPPQTNTRRAMDVVVRRPLPQRARVSRHQAVQRIPVRSTAKPQASAPRLVSDIILAH